MAAHPPGVGSGLTVPCYERPSGVHPPLGFAGYHSTALRAASDAEGAIS